jgi:hypothetical protein
MSEPRTVTEEERERAYRRLRWARQRYAKRPGSYVALVDLERAEALLMALPPERRER